MSDDAPPMRDWPWHNIFHLFTARWTGWIVERGTFALYRWRKCKVCNAIQQRSFP